jgi:hypothetical protein
MSVDFFECVNCGETVCECGPYWRCRVCGIKLCEECEEKIVKPEEESEGDEDESLLPFLY